MRHRNNKLLKLWGTVQSRDLKLRVMLTNLITHGHITTTEKKAKVLTAYADKFFARLVRLKNTLDQEDFQRESARFVKSRVFGNDEGKKAVNDFLPSLMTKKTSSGFFTSVKLWKRIGDGAEKVRVEFVQ